MIAFLNPAALRPLPPLATHCPLSLSQAVPRRKLLLAPPRGLSALRPTLDPGHQQFSTIVSMLKEGDKAPAFSAEDTDGNTVSLDSLSGSKVVLYFSNLAGPGCTSQSCSFRDAEAQFQRLDAKIIAVSAQNKATSISFKDSNGLKFPVIPDKERTLQKLFGVPTTFGLIPGRITYVLDRQGVVRSTYNSQFSVGAHIDVAKEALQSIE